MTAPVFAKCKCAHSKQRHEVRGFAPQCTADACTCLNYRPDLPPTSLPAGRPAAVVPSPLQTAVDSAGENAEPAAKKLTVTQALTAARDSDVAATKRLGQRIEDLVDDLRERVANEAAAVDLKNHIAELEQKLADAKNTLKAATSSKRTPPAVAAVPGSHSCPDCEQTFDTAQGRGSHRARVHGYRKAG